VGRKDGERIDNGAAISSGGSSTHAFFSPRLGIGGVFFWFLSLLACAMTCYEATTTTHGHTTHTHILYIHLHTHTHYANYCRFDMRLLHDELLLLHLTSHEFVLRS